MTEEPVCRGDLLLGTACRRCARCKAERERLRSLAQQVEELNHQVGFERGQRDAHAKMARYFDDKGEPLSWQSRALASEAKLASVREALERITRFEPNSTIITLDSAMIVQMKHTARGALSLLGEE
jgi:hypothetical protein